MKIENHGAECQVRVDWEHFLFLMQNIDKSSIRNLYKVANKNSLFQRNGHEFRLRRGLFLLMPNHKRMDKETNLYLMGGSTMQSQEKEKSCTL